MLAVCWLVRLKRMLEQDIGALLDLNIRPFVRGSFRIEGKGVIEMWGIRR